MRSHCTMFCIAILLSQTANAALVTVFSTDFDSGVPSEFSGITTTESVRFYSRVRVAGAGFTGDFIRNTTGGSPQGTAGSSTTLTLSGLPAHDSVDLNFLLAIIDSWDGSTTVDGTAPVDTFNVLVDGNPVFSETFDNFFGLDDGSYSPPAGGLLSSGSSLGFNGEWPDSAYDMSIEPVFDVIPHTASSITIEWFADGTGWQGGNNESWGIENVELAVNLVPEPSSLQPGDADQDFDFDQLDLVQVQIAAKYLSGQAATWGEGDWNGAPGGTVGSPPVGDAMFNQLDIVAAQQAAIYLTGPYAAVGPDGQANDDQTSVVYNAGTGEVAVDAPAGTELTSINIDSAAGVFTGSPAQNLGGSFDNDADGNIFKATFGGSFGSLSFGNVAQADLAEDFLLGDLTVVGSLQGGGALGDVDLIYVPEPSTALTLILGTLALFGRRRRVLLV